MKRIILHCDLNNFYASVECMSNPNLIGKFVAVCGRLENRHGVILAKNDKAKQCGVRTGETIWEAKIKCKDLIIVPPNFSDYSRISKQIKEIYKEYSDRVESFGIDEAWIDVSESVSLFGDGEEIANKLKKRIYETFKITISVGISFNKIYAKLGSDCAKANEIIIFTEENYKDKVFPLDVGDLLYVGKSTKLKLRKMGITTIGELATFDQRLLKIRLGKMGEVLYDFANGIDHSEVALFDESTKLKSIGNGITPIRDLEDIEDTKLILYILCDSIATRMRMKKVLGKCVSVQFRSKDLISFSRQVTVTQTNLCEEIVHTAIQLTLENYPFDIALRSISVKVSQLVDEQEYYQLSLFSNHDKIENIERCIDEIREKFGIHSITRANMLLDRELTKFSPLEDHLIFPQSYFK